MDGWKVRCKGLDSGFYSQKKEKVKNGGNVHTSFIAVHAQNMRETNENM